VFSDWISFLTYPNLFGIKGFVVVVVVVDPVPLSPKRDNYILEALIN
jgi:hypothetical protein